MNPFTALKNLSPYHVTSLFNFIFSINPSLHFTLLFISTTHFPWLQCIYCLTQLSGGYIYIIYYIEINYMFRHFSLAIFRLVNEILVSSYTRLACIAYSGEVKGEVGTRSGMCCVGWVVWVQGFWYFSYSRLTLWRLTTNIGVVPHR